MIKRVFLFVITNIVVMLTLGVVFALLRAFTPLGAWMDHSGNNMAPLLVISAFWGMGGSFISLLISRWMAKRATGAVVLDPNTVRAEDAWLVSIVHRLAKEAGISEMPEVAIYPSPEINAFATGATKNSALVAVSQGILDKMNHEELEGVLAHEISHIANGDMVTLTLVQGVVNSFVMFLSWVITLAISQAMRGKDDDRREGFGDYMLRSFIHSLISNVLFFGAYIAIIAPFSRYREFRADAGGAKRAGTPKMIHALEALKRISSGGNAVEAAAQAGSQAPALAAFKISGDWASLTSTHPPLEERIAALKNAL